MDSIKLKKVKQGDCIGFFSSSSPTDQQSLDMIKEYFLSKGYPVKFSKNILNNKGDIAGTAEERKKDFHELLLDEDVKLIVTANGGKGALQILPLVDYKAVKQARKGIVGLSDPSVLLNAITSKTGLISIHGPNGFNFSSLKISDYTERNWWSFIAGAENKSYEFELNKDITQLKSGIAKGKLFGGHLRTIRNIFGTPWEPDWNGCILFIEEISTEYGDIDTMLTYLKYIGIFKKISGLIIGALECCSSGNSVESIEDIVLRNCKGYDFPIIGNALIGHTNDKLTLPIGGTVILDVEKKKLVMAESIFE